jgi:hypothetical protein
MKSNYTAAQRLSAWLYGGDAQGFPGYSLRITFER